MTLVKLLIALIVVHMALGISQMTLSYWAGDVADYGAAGVISHTPLGSLLRVEADRQSGPPSTLESFRNLLVDFFSTITGLLNFRYGILHAIEPGDGMVYNVVMALRLAGVLAWFGLGMGTLKMLFDSGLLNSTVGIIIAGTLFGIGSVASAGEVVLRG